MQVPSEKVKVPLEGQREVPFDVGLPTSQWQHLEREKDT